MSEGNSENMHSNTFLNNIYMLKVIFKISPARVLCSFLNALIQYFGWVFYSIIFVKYVLNALDQQESFREIVLFLSLSMAVFMVMEFFMAWYNQRYKLIADQVIYYKLNRALFDKAGSVDISCYENPDFYNIYTLAVKESNERAISVLDSISGLIVSVLSSVFVVYTMYSIDKYMAFLTILPVIGSFVFGKFINKFTYLNDKYDVPYNRRMDYVNRVFFLQKYAKEIRLSRISNILLRIYGKAYSGVLGNVDKYGKKIFCMSYLRDFLCYPVVFEGVWFYAAFRAIILKDLSVAECVVLANAMVAATNMLLNVMRSIVSISNNGLYIRNLRLFFSYREKISEEQQGCSISNCCHKLEFRNVSFTYEGQSKPTLENISFIINSNEKMALVGHNGAGKTTLVKLMMRLYDVTEGEILLDGINIKEYNLKEYRRLFGTVFQDYQVLSISAVENVAMSAVTDDIHREKCVEAMKKSGVYEKIITFKNGIDTTMTREYDDEGAILSGGELQKIAISRVFAKDARIIVLDEPSSALDPIAEYQMYETLLKTFGSQEEQKMVVLISHRLSSAVLADKICVFENGRIVEMGTHAELMKSDGKYGDMFRKQARNYVDEKLHLKLMDIVAEDGEAV